MFATSKGTQKLTCEPSQQSQKIRSKSYGRLALLHTNFDAKESDFFIDPFDIKGEY